MAIFHSYVKLLEGKPILVGAIPTPVKKIRVKVSWDDSRLNRKMINTFQNTKQPL